MATYDPTGPYLDYARQPAIETWTVVRLDREGIPMVRYGARHHYNAGTIAQWGLQGYSRWKLQPSLTAGRDQALQAARWLADHQDPLTGLWYAEFPLSVSGAPLTPPWPSGLWQGLACSLFRRVQTVGLDVRQAGQRALLFANVDTAHGGFRARAFDHTIFEEYPTSPPHLTLNGHMFAVLGFHEWSTLAGVEQPARSLHLAGLAGLERIVEMCDNGVTGSLYSLVHIAVPGSQRSIATAAYHALHIRLLDALVAVSGSAVLQKESALWKTYKRA